MGLTLLTKININFNSKTCMCNTNVHEGNTYGSIYQRAYFSIAMEVTEININMEQQNTNVYHLGSKQKGEHTS